MKKAIPLCSFLLFIGASCPGKPPEPPTPTPTPPLTNTLPDKGVPLGPERLLRNNNNKNFQTNDGKRVDFFGAEPCCHPWAKCPNQGWPNVSECFIDETTKYGANLYHFRIGPWLSSQETEWADIGGAYLADGNWNENYWKRIRELVWKLYQNNQYIEIVPVDDWWLKNACSDKDNGCGKPVPWSNEAILAWGNTPHPEHERLIRKTVEETGCFGNVIYATGNEEDLIPGTNVSHLNYRVNTIRDEEKKTGCNFVHMIGTGSDKDGIEADYSITHNCSPITGPLNGRLAVQNECNDNISPDQWASYYSGALKAGQRWDAWRGAESDDNKWEERLKKFGDILKGEVIPIGCYAPDPNDPKWVDPPTNRPPQMMAAINEAKARVGNRCGATAPCVDSPCAPPVHLGCLETNALVAAELRKMGHCASGPWVDATVVKAPDGLWEEYHICSTGDGCYTGNPYKFAWEYKGDTPIAGCSSPVPGKVSKFNLKLEGTSWYNGTPIVKGHEYCKSIGMEFLPDGTTPRNECPVRNECPGFKCEERAACERVSMSGLAIWHSDGNLRVDTDNENNLLAKCTACTYIEVCNADGSVCTRSVVE